jgi:hypothetical protein
MYPVDAIHAFPNLRGMITMGIDAKARGSQFEFNSHLGIMLRSLADPHDTEDPIVAAFGTDIYDEDRAYFVNDTFMPLRGRFVEVEATPTSLSITEL